jgi:biopolymer transport protein ExbD
MAYRFRGHYTHKAVIDITPLIDLTFNMIIFFMVSFSLGVQSSITVHLPRAVQSGDEHTGPVVVSVTDKNEVFINDVAVKRESLVEEFTKRKKELGRETVLIRGDREADYETIIKVMDGLNRAGIPKFILSTVK